MRPVPGTATRTRIPLLLSLALAVLVPVPAGAVVVSGEATEPGVVAEAAAEAVAEAAAEAVAGAATGAVSGATAEAGTVPGEAATPAAVAGPAARSHAELLAGGERFDLSEAATVEGIPYFARRYGLQCSTCHISPPKLNDFGEAFARRNYRLPQADPRTRRTIPFAIWASGRSDFQPAPPGEERSFRSYVNRVEVVSGGPITDWLSFFVEWRPVSFELQADRSLRDRSGRFEDLFLVANLGEFEVAVGQFRQIQQVDISRRLGVNEPAYFSRGLPGILEGTPRDRFLQTFSLSGRSPGVRAGWTRELPGGWAWTTYATLPLPGELSVPLTRDARTNASFELGTDPKGVFLESFFHQGMMTYGAHLFMDPGDRALAGAVATGRRGPWMWTGAGGGARGLDGSVRGRWSLEGEYVLTPAAAFGARGEGHAGLDPALVTYGNFHFPGTTYTLRLTIEQRLQAGRGTTLVELGAVF